ncbi:MAG: asparagine synthase (glutamine-hydrolyzing) [Chlamydiota bacterium]
MCGILGFYACDGQDISDGEFLSFVDSLQHRGPDGRGMYRDANESLRLGHRRLSILDLSDKATQPFSYCNGRFWITYNGEIYNFLELRALLEQEGHVFKTESDTEVILASYIHWKEDCQLRFNGMWAFAIWDSKEKTLFLSRDRFGVKPLYYYYDGKKLAFASELKAFLFLSSISISVKEAVIANTLYDPNSLEWTEETFLHNVKKLRAGHCATFHKDRGVVCKRWWNTLDHLEEVSSFWEEQVGRFRDLFIDSCRIRMRSDVPLGSGVSGGLDSTSVFSVCMKLAKQGGARFFPSLPTMFTAIFPGTSKDESVFANEVALNTGAVTEHCSINQKSFLDHLEKAMYHVEEIFDLPMGPFLLYREFRRKNIVISLDGHGADELLGGYHHQMEKAMANALLRGQIPTFLSVRNTLKGLFQPGVLNQNFDLLSVLSKEGIRSIRDLHWLKNAYHRWNHFLDKPWLSFYHQPPDVSDELKNEKKYHEMKPFERLLYRDFHYLTLPVILRNFDRCSMAHGVEIRSPFLDWRLVCYSFSLSQGAKMGEGYTKRILREAMKGTIPNSIRLRTGKIGFASPMEDWFSTKGVKSFVLDRLNSSSFLKSTIWKGKKIRDFVEKNYERKNFSEVRKCWEFLHADYLMEIFKK